MVSINPATGQKIAEYAPMGAEAVSAKAQLAQSAFLDWRLASFEQRADLMRRAASELRESSSKYAELITLEMGKPIAQSEAEIEKCAWVCDFYSENAERFLSEEVVDTDASYSAIRYEPMGAVLAVMPWNFPFWQVFRFAAPALMAGNVGLLKHASTVTGCSLAIEGVFQAAGFPGGCFTSLLMDNSQVAELIGNPVIKAVTLTGSEGAGRAIASEAGAQVKKTVLELGGSDPFIVLKDADLEAAALNAVLGRTQNAGQSCIAAKRFIVERAVIEDFTQLFVGKMKLLRIGDPREPDTQVGPLARKDLVDALHSQVEQSVLQGATLLAGGRRIDRAGFFYEPTVLTDVRPGMAAFDEETFGPLAAICVAVDEADAIELANASPYGLGSSLWTKDLNKARALAREIESGSVFVNGIVKSDPRLPFGGVKLSGYGRELSKEGIREFTNIKSVWVK